MTTNVFEQLADEPMRERLAARRERLTAVIQSMTLEQQLERFCPTSERPSEWPTPWPRAALHADFWKRRYALRHAAMVRMEAEAIDDLRRRLRSPELCICGCEDITGSHLECWVGGNFAIGHPDRFRTVACRCKLVAEKGKFRDWLLSVSGLKALGPLVPSFSQWREDRFPEAKELRDAFMDWSQDRTDGKDWLFVSGPPGTGKSHLCQAATLAVVGRNKRAVYVDILEFIAEGRRRIGDPDGRFSEWVTSIKKAPYLVIDDIGQEYSTDWTASVLREILHYRYMHAVPTLVCSNKKPSELVKSLGEATVDRFMDAQLCVSIDIKTGKSQRALLGDGD